MFLLRQVFHYFSSFVLQPCGLVTSIPWWAPKCTCKTFITLTRSLENVFLSLKLFLVWVCSWCSSSWLSFSIRRLGLKGVEYLQRHFNAQVRFCFTSYLEKVRSKVLYWGMLPLIYTILRWAFTCWSCIGSSLLRPMIYPSNLVD